MKGIGGVVIAVTLLGMLYMATSERDQVMQERGKHSAQCEEACRPHGGLFKVDEVPDELEVGLGVDWTCSCLDGELFKAGY